MKNLSEKKLLQFLDFSKNLAFWVVIKKIFTFLLR